MERTLRPRRALALLLTALAPVPAGAQGSGDFTAHFERISWTVLKPTNTGIAGDYGLDVFIDASDRPWIPGRSPFFQEGGLSRWDEATDTWYALSSVDHPVLPGGGFDDVDADAGGTMWIGGYGGLVRYDPALGPTSLQRYDSSNSPMPNDWVRDLSVAPDGTIWLAIHNSSGPFGGLVQFDPVAGTWNVWTTANGLPWGTQWPGWDWVDYVAAAPDDDGGYTVYFGSTEMGCASYKDGVFVSFVLNPPPQGPQIWGLPGGDVVDDLGNTWLSTEIGLVRRSPDGTMTPVAIPASGRVEAFRGGRAGLASSQGQVWVYDGVAWSDLGFWGATLTWGLAEEASGEVWVVGNAGAARHDGVGWQRYRMTNTGMVGRFVKTIDFDADGNVYMNGNAATNVGGFSLFDGRRWTCVNDLNYGLGPPWGLPSDDCEALCVRAGGRVAVAPSGLQGLFEWDGTTFEPLVPQGFSIDLVAEDGRGRLWASEDYGGIHLLGAGGSWTFFPPTGGQVPVGQIGSIAPDPEAPGWVWIAATTGLAYTNGETWVTYTPQQIGLVRGFNTYLLADVDRDDDGTLWLGSFGAGLIHFDPGAGVLARYDMTNSTLPSDWVRLVEIAPDRSIWASTFDTEWPYPGGLSRFDGKGWLTWTRSSSPLPHNQHLALTSRATRTGYEVWVGTASEGVAVVTVEKLAPPRRAPTRQAPLGPSGSR